MTVRPDLPPLPDRIERLPVHNGFPVPWFVAWLSYDGKTELAAGAAGATPDFRVIHSGAIEKATAESLCWICGQKRGGWSAYVLGPMCAINHTSAEPTCHVECAEWAAKACPFLTRPHARRRDNNKPEGAEEAAGIALKRNPGVVGVWVVHGRLLRRDLGLFDIGDPARVSWWREGRPATAAEVLKSVDSGLPSLRTVAEEQGPYAVAHLEALTERARRLIVRTAA